MSREVPLFIRKRKSFNRKSAAQGQTVLSTQRIPRKFYAQ